MGQYLSLLWLGLLLLARGRHLALGNHARPALRYHAWLLRVLALHARDLGSLLLLLLLGSLLLLLLLLHRHGLRLYAHALLLSPTNSLMANLVGIPCQIKFETCVSTASWTRGQKLGAFEKSTNTFLHATFTVHYMRRNMLNQKSWPQNKQHPCKQP